MVNILLVVKTFFLLFRSSVKQVVVFVLLFFVMLQQSGELLSTQVRYTDIQEQEFHSQATSALAYGHFQVAERLADSRSKSDPSGATLRAKLLIMRGQSVDAENLLAPIAQLNPSSIAGLEFGFLLVRMGRVGEALVFFEAVLISALRSQQAVDNYHGALAARFLGRYRQANQLFSNAAKALPNDPAIHTAWGNLFLEKYNNGSAAQSFQEALELDNDWGPAHLGMARVLADENPTAARVSAERVLHIDTNNVKAHLFVAEQEFGNGNTEAAQQSLKRVFEVNPTNLEAVSLMAAIAYLDDDTAEFEVQADLALKLNPAYGELYRVVGRHAARAYRFDEAVSLVRHALEVDPSNSRAQAELGMHLLRVGDEAEARVVLEQAFAQDPFDVITFNLLSMMDTLDQFETFQYGDIVLRLHPEEVPVLKDYMLSMAQEALDTLSAKYEMKVQGPILIEVFPRHDDFAVRNLGLPGLLGALGACFGRVVTMDSPRARVPGEFNWRATLWHEIAHVVTLQMSNQRVPRWLTEGISVYEEARARPAWGRDQEIAFAQALNNNSVLALKDLNSGFLKPETISLAYYEASLLVEHIVEFYGDMVLRNLVKAYGDGLDTEEALQKVELNFDILQTSFDKAIEVKFRDLRRALKPIEEESIPEDKTGQLDTLRRLADEYSDRFSVQFSLGIALREVGEIDAALEAFEKAAALVPMSTGIGSPLGIIAEIAEERGDYGRAMRELERLLEYDHTSVEVARKLASLAEAAGDQERMFIAHDRLIGIDPFDAIPHQSIGRLALARGETKIAIREFQIALAVGPIDKVEAYCDLAESYLLAGQVSEAKQAVLMALEMAPTYERAQDLLLRTIE